jgi:hypothetical protein
MKQYVAIVSHTVAGVITKFKDYDIEADAIAHVGTYGGKVVTGITDNDLEYWNVLGDPVKDTNALTAAINSNIAINEIRRLENSITPRRVREAVATQAGKDWIATVETAIDMQRGLL